MAKKKDPNAPKRGMSAFMFYSCDRRPQLKSQNPDWPFGEFAKAIGAEWGQMNDKQKGKFQKMAEKDKKRYDREMENYDPPSELTYYGVLAKGLKGPYCWAASMNSDGDCITVESRTPALSAKAVEGLLEERDRKKAARGETAEEDDY